MAAGAVAIALLVPGVVLMLTLHVLIICWALRRAAGARDFVAEGPAEVDSAGLSADELDKLPCYDFRAGGASGNRAVCLEAFRAGERCRLLPRCEHSFHAPCVDAWLCPICRAEAVGPRPKAAVVAMGVPEGRSPATLEIVAER